VFRTIPSSLFSLLSSPPPLLGTAAMNNVDIEKIAYEKYLAYSTEVSDFPISMSDSKDDL
jgi:hypothetical protein